MLQIHRGGVGRPAAGGCCDGDAHAQGDGVVGRQPEPCGWRSGCARNVSTGLTVSLIDELRCLTDLAGTVDQLNLEGRCSVESSRRLIAAIVEACAVPGRPSWEHSRFYAGVGNSEEVGNAEEVVAPALRTGPTCSGGPRARPR